MLFFSQATINFVDEHFEKFMKECGNYFREGVVTDQSPSRREDIAKLLRFESSKERPGKLKSLMEYVSGMKEDQKEIFFLLTNAP